MFNDESVDMLCVLCVCVCCVWGCVCRCHACYCTTLLFCHLPCTCNNVCTAMAFIKFMNIKVLNISVFKITRSCYCKYIDALKVNF